MSASGPPQQFKKRLIPAMHQISRATRFAWRRLPKPDIKRQFRERTRRIRRIEAQVQQLESPYHLDSQSPLLFFDASSHLTNLSFNAATSLLTAWSLRLAGQSVISLACHGGLGKCVLGLWMMGPQASPPCTACIRHHSVLHPPRHTVIFAPSPSTYSELEASLASLPFEALVDFHHGELEVGTLCLPAARWVLRRWNLQRDPTGHQVLAAFIASAIQLADELERLFATRPPRTLITFNGTYFPEAIARAVATAHDVPTITYEVGHRPLSTFFSPGIAPEYSLSIPDSFQLGTAEHAVLDQYMARRIQGDFTMGGVRVWPEMRHLSPSLQQKAALFGQMVTVFTNVVFDSSQIYAHTIFEDMFDWLDETIHLVQQHPQTLFVLRAHPDEMRPGKESQETVEHWLHTQGYLDIPNLVFIPPTEYISSYDLAAWSQFCLVYNSTIGIEATILGTPVINGGRSRYSQEAFTHRPPDRAAYRNLVRSFIQHGPPCLLEAWHQRARRYMYYSLFHASLDLSAFIAPLSQYDYTITPFDAAALHPDNSPEWRIICDGILNGTAFAYS